MVGMGETYLAAFVLALGLGDALSGLVASIPQLGGALLQLATPAAVRRLRSHRRWVIVCAAVQGLSFLPLVIGAIVGRLPAAAVFLIATIYWASGMGAGAAWNAWMGRIVPPQVRSNYFAKRSRWAHLAVLCGVLASGLSLHFGGGKGEHLYMFALLFAGAGLARLVSSYYLAAQSEPPLQADDHQDLPILESIGRFRGGSGRVLLYMLCVQVGVYVAQPFFNPFMLNRLHLPYHQYMTLLAASFMAKYFSCPLLGRFAYRFGPRRLLWFGGLGIIPLAALWLVSDSFWYLLPMQLFAGAAWAAYELATLLLLFETVPGRERTSVLSVYNLGNAAAMSGGSLVGSMLLSGYGPDAAGYVAAFFVSTVARVLTVGLLRRVADVRLRPVPMITRPIAVRPSAGSIEGPVLPSLPDEELVAPPAATRSGPASPSG